MKKSEKVTKLSRRRRICIFVQNQWCWNRFFGFEGYILYMYIYNTKSRLFRAIFGGWSSGVAFLDYFSSHEISLKFPNHRKFLMCSQILPSKMWRECAWKHDFHEVDSEPNGEAIWKQRSCFTFRSRESAKRDLLIQLSATRHSAPPALRSCY